MILEHESYGSVMDALPMTPKGHGHDGETRGVSPSSHHHHHDQQQDDDGDPSTPIAAPSTFAAANSHKDAKNKTSRNNNNVTFSPGTPFFIMDWLKDVNPEDLELARKILQTPNKNHRSNITVSYDDADDKDKQALKKDLFASSSRRCSLTSAIATTSTATPSKLMTGQRNSQSTSSIIIPQTPLSPVDKTQSTTSSPAPKYSGFHRRSITIGNGWNAKGLQKAKQGQWQDALACWENALEIRKQVLDDADHHVDVANTYNNMGIALGRLHCTEQAMTCLHAALEIRTLHYGRPGKQQQPQEDADDSSSCKTNKNKKGLQEVAATLHNLANVHQQAGDLKTALEYFEESMQLLQQILGKDHVHVARAHVAIGHLRYEANDIYQAQQAYQTGLEIMERACSEQEERVNEIASIRADLQEVEALLLLQQQQREQDDDDDEKDTKSKISVDEVEERKAEAEKA